MMTDESMDVSVRFECGMEDRVSREYRFPFVQLTYDTLRVGPDGDDLAVLDDESQEWRLATTAAVPDEELRAWWSDVIISSATVAEGTGDPHRDPDAARNALQRATRMDTALQAIAGIRLNGERCPAGCRGPLCGRDGDDSHHDIGSSDAEYELLRDCVERARAALGAS